MSSKFSKDYNSHNGNKLPRWHIQKVLSNLDIFGKEMPHFNLEGEGKVNTAVGGFLSGCILALAFAYASIKLIHLWNKDNPIVSEISLPDHFDSFDKFNMKEINKPVAFAVEGYFDNLGRYDTRYVKTMVRLYSIKDGLRTSRDVSYHKCKDEDMTLFYPIQPKSKDLFERIYSDENRGFFCIDWDQEDVEIYGQVTDATNFNNLEII